MAHYLKPKKWFVKKFVTLSVCRECADAELDNECNDAGDCWRGKCICDPYFSGFKCQIARKFVV